MNNYKQNSGCSEKAKTSLFIGLLVITAGVLWLGFNMGWVDSTLRQVLFSWRIIFVIFTIYYIIKRELFTTLIFAILSLFFFFPKLAEVYPDAFSWIGDDFRRNLFPIALILAGICIIFRIFFGKNRKIRNWGKSRNYVFTDASGTDEGDNIYNKNVIFGGAEDVFLEPVFRGGAINVIFGGVELDLRKTTLPEGDTHLATEVIFGGIDLRLPDNWKVERNISVIFGGVDENRKKASHVIEIDHSRRLIITGNVIFGGVEIRYYGDN